MERRGSQEIRLHVVWRQVVAGGQSGLVELHRPVGGGEQPVPKPDFHMSGGWDDVDRVAMRHDATGYRWVAAPGDAHSRRSLFWGQVGGRGLDQRVSHCCKRVLTDGFDSFSVVTVKPSESFWDAWERIRTSADPDPLEVLQVAAAFSRYFDAAQKEAISFARSAGLSWEQIAESLGQSRQALWQRASRDASLQALLVASGKRRWEAVKRDPISWYGETKAFPAQS
jgi:hypothetical protein